MADQPIDANIRVNALKWDVEQLQHALQVETNLKIDVQYKAEELREYIAHCNLRVENARRQNYLRYKEGVEEGHARSRQRIQDLTLKLEQSECRVAILEKELSNLKKKMSEAAKTRSPCSNVMVMITAPSYKDKKAVDRSGKYGTDTSGLRGGRYQLRSTTRTR